MTSPNLPVDFITNAEARYLTLFAQRLETSGPKSNRRPPTPPDLLELVRQMGVLQLDSISVVSRAHETAVWSRAGTYSAADLTSLHYPDAQLFEYWMHAASLVPVEFFPYVRRRMETYANDTLSSHGTWGHEHRDLLNSVLDTVRDQGPVSTRAFVRPEGVDRAPWDWWGGKPAKQALDWLWSAGELVILRRQGFERIYELTDRAMPDARTVPLPTLEEQNDFFTSRSLQSLGIGTVPWIADFFRPGASRYVNASDTALCMQQLERDDRAIRVAVEGLPAPAWLDTKLLPVLDAFRRGDLRAKTRTLLSPFDNILWRRDRALALFGFDYRLESYTPEPKRIYGYYTLPILIDGKFVGRLDPRYRRKERLLVIPAIHLEPGVRVTAGLAAAIAGVLKTFLHFLGGTKTEVLSSNPPALLALLQTRLN